MRMAAPLQSIWHGMMTSRSRVDIILLFHYTACVEWLHCLLLHHGLSLHSLHGRFTLEILLNRLLSVYSPIMLIAIECAEVF